MDMSNFVGEFEMNVPTTVQTVCTDITANEEIGRDFVLPDYQPEIRKVLRLTPSVRPPSRFLGTDEAEFSGNVGFDLLYIGGDGGLYSASLSAPYSFRMPLAGSDRMSGDRPICADAEITALSSHCRLSAPRKLHIGCHLHARLVGLCDEQTDVRGLGGADTERLERTVTVGRCADVTGEAMELTDEIPVSGEGELRLIGAEGAVHVSEAAVGEDGVACRGELYLKVMVTRDPMPQGEEPPSAGRGEVEVLTRRLPFSQTIGLDAPVGREECRAAVCGSCTDVHVRVEEDRLLCAVSVVLQARAQGNEKVTFIRDCYAVARPTVCEMRSYAPRRGICCVNGNVTSGGTVEGAQAGIPTGAEPLDVSGSATVTEISCERGHAVLTGEGTYRLLYRTAEGEIGHAEFPLPLRYELPDGGLDPSLRLGADARMTMISGRARVEGDGSYTVDAEWTVSARIYAQDRIEAVDEVRAEGDALPSSAACVICYPAAGETLWRVAKRYRTPLRTLAVMNDLPGSSDADSPQSLQGVHFLMIG